MRPLSAERRADPAGGLGVEPWRHDDLAAWLQGGLAEVAAAAPGARVWRAIERELSVPPAAASGWRGLRHAYASLGSLVAVAYALAFGALLMAPRSADSRLMSCPADCPWDRLTEDEIARQQGRASAGVDAYAGWFFRVRQPLRDRELWRSERYERQIALEWGSAADASGSGGNSTGASKVEMD